MDQWENHRKTVKTFNISGHVHFMTFSCFHRMPLLTSEVWRIWLRDSIRHALQKYDMALWAYVFMPEHVHLMVRPRKAQYDLSEFRKSLKQGLSKRVIQSLLERKAPLLDKIRVQERPGKWCYRFWQEGPGHDVNIWTMEMAIEKAEYCHNNPVKRGLVRSPEA